MSNDITTRARELLDAATPGPWEAQHRTDLDWLSQSPAIDNTGHEPGSTVRPEGATDPSWQSVWPGRNARADAEFIAASPELVAGLLAVVERVEKLAEGCEKTGWRAYGQFGKALRNALEGK